MAKEFLAIPEQHLHEVIIVIRTGLAYATISDEVRERLREWCEDEAEYLARLEEEAEQGV